MKCNACVSLQHGKHECSERGMDSECPVCKEFLADSETPVKELPCGHLMHAGCFAHVHAPLLHVSPVSQVAR